MEFEWRNYGGPPAFIVEIQTKQPFIAFLPVRVAMPCLKKATPYLKKPMPFLRKAMDSLSKALEFLSKATDSLSKAVPYLKKATGLAWYFQPSFGHSCHYVIPRVIADHLCLTARIFSRMFRTYIAHYPHSPALASAGQLCHILRSRRNQKGRGFTMTVTAFTNDIQVTFTEDALEFTEGEAKSLSYPYHEHPEVFGHPRLLMADFHKSAALVRMALLHLKGNRMALIAPKIVVSFPRKIAGGITEMDKRTIAQIFMEAGVRKVEFPGS